LNRYPRRTHVRPHSARALRMELRRPPGAPPVFGNLWYEHNTTTGHGSCWTPLEAHTDRCTCEEHRFEKEDTTCPILASPCPRLILPARVV
jgi:hypothetical protein